MLQDSEERDKLRRMKKRKRYKKNLKKRRFGHSPDPLSSIQVTISLFCRGAGYCMRTDPAPDASHPCLLALFRVHDHAYFITFSCYLCRSLHVHLHAVHVNAVLVQ